MTLTKKQPIVFVMVAILMAMPFAGSNAFADTVVLNANLDSVCGLGSIAPVEMGSLIPGQIGAEAELVISQDPNANVSAEFEISGTDWTDDEPEVDATVHMQSEVTRFNFTFDGTSSLTPNDPDAVPSVTNESKYVSKTAIGADGAIQTLGTTQFNAGNHLDIRLALQLSGDGTLENLPYVGDLKQTLTFTLTCNAI